MNEKNILTIRIDDEPPGIPRRFLIAGLVLAALFGINQALELLLRLGVFK